MGKDRKEEHRRASVLGKRTLTVKYFSCKEKSIGRDEALGRVGGGFPQQMPTNRGGGFFTMTFSNWKNRED